jgi:drug/metabolite transporter (DMT)-like permease
MSRHARHLLQIHLAVVLFGFAGLFGKLLTLSPHVIVFGRVMFAALTLGAAALVWRDILGPLPRRGLRAFLALGVLLAVHWTTFFQSVQTCGVALALITYSTFPVFVAFLEPLLFPEPLRLRDVLLAAVALCGIIILTPSWQLGDQITQGILWGIASGLTFALLSLLNRKYVRQHSSMTIALYQDLFAAVALLPLIVWHWPALTVKDVLLLLVLGVLCTAVAHSLFIAGMHGITARTASMIACLEPVYGVLLAALLLPHQEIPTPRTLLGGSLILGVAFYATLEPPKKNEPRMNTDKHR